MVEHIKIQSTTPRIRYIADGELTSFEYPFAIFKAEDLQVYFNETLQTGGYTVSGAGETDGGSVAFTSAPSAGTTITFARKLKIERTSDFQEGGALRANVLNGELDYQIACLQEVADNLNRSMVLPPYAVDTGVSLTLPTPVAGKAIIWNEQGTNLENSTVAVNELESTIAGYKDAAESAKDDAVAAKNTAISKASEAASSASTATSKASEAAASAAAAASSISNKANKDMDNLSTTGKEAVVAFGMPDYSAGVSLGDPSTYQALPVDCYVRWSRNNAGSIDSVGVYIANSAETVVIDFRMTANYLSNLGVPVPAGWKVKGFSGHEAITYYPMKGVSNA